MIGSEVRPCRVKNLDDRVNWRMRVFGMLVLSVGYDDRGRKTRRAGSYPDASSAKRGRCVDPNRSVQGKVLRHPWTQWSSLNRGKISVLYPLAHS